ncbi:MAG: hypothetical protein VX003_15780, partial [SAR324 cluster bacterium]|nr:hypothetical protein [SAR324 cluster bacterium]
NTTNSSYAKAGDNLTLTFNASELIETPLVTLAGTNVDVQDTNSGAGTSWQATYTVQDGDNGTVALSIQYQDQAGNTDDNVTTTDLGNLITMDTLEPTLSSVRLNSNNSLHSSLVKAGQTVTLDFTSSESLNNPVVTLGGETQILYGQGKNWSATYEIHSGDDSLIYPSEIEGLSLWLDAENVDGNFNNSIAEGAVISQWNDISGNENHAKKVWGNVAFNSTSGLKSLVFDGDDSFKLTQLPSQMGIQNSDYEIFMVIRNQDSDPGFVFAGGLESYEIHTTIGSDKDGIRFIPADSTVGGDDYVDLSVSNMVYEKTSILNARVNDDEGFIQINGENSGDTVTNARSNDNSILHIGFRSGGTFTFKGHISEILVFNKKLTNFTRNKVNHYLSEKWNLKSTVDSDDDDLVDASDNYPVGLISEPRPVSFKISFTDLAGNSGVSIDNTSSGNIIGIDTSIPVLTSVKVSSNNLDNTSLAKADDNVTLTVQSSEALQALELVKSDGSRESLVATDDSKTSWQYSRMVQTGENGVFGFQLEYSDPVGNKGAVINTSTDGSMVTLDTVVPDLTSYGVKVNEASSFTAKSGDILKVEFSTTETIRTPVVRIGGE